ncbi:MAG: mitochondrial fission ELM1 family protein [Gammaproteobacteria bacterium]|nr:mitochondrial fission ELM1 family protein [Gammaproteobacteria bacterium]
MLALTPVTWLLLGDKRGDNGQVEAVAAALGWPCDRKVLVMRSKYVVAKPRFRRTLDHLDLERSDPLTPPWPELIITVGRRPAMAALWVRQQSGNRTRVVHIGKPSGAMHVFDLVVASGENHLPPLPNYLPVTLPLMRVSTGAIQAEAERWRSRLASLQRPLIAVFVGGPTGPFVMNARVTRALLAETRRIRDLGGTPYVVTSRRTPAAVVARLRKQLPSDVPFFAWPAETEQDDARGSQADNPYRALLGTANGFVVTGDSISMLVEVAALGKPLAIFPLPTGLLGGVDQARRVLLRKLFDLRRETRADRVRQWLARLVYRFDYFGLLNGTRDFRYFHQLLVERHLAVWVGEPFRIGGTVPPDDLEVVVRRIRALVGSRPA